MDKSDQNRDVKDWKDDHFGLLSIASASLVIIYGLYMLAMGIDDYSFVFSFTCMAAVYISPFGIIFGSLGIWYCKKHSINNAVTVSGLLINITLLFLGLYFNPFAQMARNF